MRPITRLLPLLISGIILCCGKDNPTPVTPNPNPNPNPTVTAPTLDNTATTSSDITATTAKVSSTITANGGSAITQHGHVWSETNATPTVADTKTELGITSGSFPLKFTSELKNLKANTTYNVRAYAVNGKGTTYGTATQVKTAATNLPDLGTNLPTASAIATSGVQLNGIILGQGGGPISQFGFVYAEQNVTSIPTLENGQKTEIGPLPASTSLPYNYSRQITGLKPSTTYSFRAFATNSQGTAYSPVGTFSTLAITTITNFDGTIFITAPSAIIALDARTGTQKWVINATNASGSPRLDGMHPVISGTTVFWTDREKVFRTNYNTQETIWSFTLPNSESGSLSVRASSPLIENEKLSIIKDGRLVTINPSNGSRIGNDLILGNGGTSANTLINNIFYTALSGLQAVSIAAEPKTVRWKVSVNSADTPTNLLLSDGLLIGSTGMSNTGKIVAFDVATGTKKWEYLTQASFEDGFPTVANGILYLPGSGATVHAIDAQTGVKKWTFKSPYNGDISNRGVYVSEGIVYVSMPYPNGQGGVFALDALSGAIKWEAKNTRQLSSPVVAGNVLFATADNYLSALNKETGQVIWSRLISNYGSPFSAPTVVDANGTTVFYPADSGMKQ